VKKAVRRARQSLRQWGSCKSFNSKLRNELPNSEMFPTHYEDRADRELSGYFRPQPSLSYRPPVPEAILPPARGLPTLRSDQPTGWPTRPDFTSRTGTASGGRAHPTRHGMRSARCGL
jgi:hypothetical protein